MKWTLEALALASLLACDDVTRRQPRVDPLEASDFFRDGASAREPVPGTVARGRLRTDAHFYEGRAGKDLAATFPFPVDRAALERGRERYGIFCVPCHGPAGYGNGRVVQRGFRPPPSFHAERLRSAPVGHLYDVIANGFGAMPSYRAQIPARDRWAVVAYLRALQRSQNARRADLPEAEARRLEAERP